MKVTIELSKIELDLIEEALFNYHNLLTKSTNRDDFVSGEIKFCLGVMDKFGIEKPN